MNVTTTITLTSDDFKHYDLNGSLKEKINTKLAQDLVDVIIKENLMNIRITEDPWKDEKTLEATISINTNRVYFTDPRD